MTTDTLPQVLRDWVDAQNEHNSAKHASLYTSDGILEDVANGFAARGHAEIATFLGKADSGLGDVEVDVTGVAVAGDAAAIEYTFAATNTGLIPIPGAKGKRFTSRAVTFFELRDGLIARSSDYYDTGAVIDQLGVTAEILAGIGRVFGPHGRKPEGGERG
jgi:steroid delta-isomerase-like uncharacterized protein